MQSFAVIFDWDGVITDSSAAHEVSWERAAAALGLPLPEDHFKRGFGMRNHSIIRDLLQWAQDDAEIARIGDMKEAMYRDIIHQDGLALLPGAAELLAALKAAGIPCAVASSTPVANLECAIDMLALEPFFEALIASEDVTRGKPDPEVFLAAGKALGFEPARCVVIEDAHVGIQAARAARMKVVAVATTHPAESLGDADRVVRSLAELDPGALAELAARWTVHGMPGV